MTDEQLLTTYAAFGADDTFAELVRRYEPKIRKFLTCGLQMYDEEAVTDSVQDTMLALHQSAPRFQPGGNTASWVLAIARNCACNRLKSRQNSCKKRERRGGASQAVDPLPGPADEAAENEELDKLRDAVSGLKGKQRSLVAAVLDGGTVNSASTKLGLPRRTINYTWHAAIKSLRKQMAN